MSDHPVVGKIEFGPTIEGAADPQDALRRAFALTERTRDTLDAERYRYLRDHALLLEDGPAVCQGLSDLFEYLHGADVDEAVDAAIAKTRNPK